MTETASSTNLPPSPDQVSGPAAIRAWFKDRTIYSIMLSFQRQLGYIYRLPTPTFTLYVLSGPEAARLMMATQRSAFQWRVEGDPVVEFLRNGVLMQDGESHDSIRRRMMPPLQRKALEDYIPEMLAFTDQVSERWEDDHEYNLHVEMRKLALIVLTGTLFNVDCSPELPWLVPAVIKAIKYISPGIWLFWRGVPRFGYKKPIRQINEYLYRIIKERRSNPSTAGDLLSILVKDPEVDDDLIRDQLVTMLIAGHDTSTCLLSWALYFLAEYPEIQSRARDEIETILGENTPDQENLGKLVFLDQVIKETLRIYPPIHAGNRITLEDIEFKGYTIPAGSRVLFSIYLTHHDENHWEDPEAFHPHRFNLDQPSRPSYTYLPFGGGPRNCIGAAYAQVEARVILARLIQRYQFISTGKHVKPYMGASLDPHPGVWLKIKKRPVQTG